MMLSVLVWLAMQGQGQRPWNNDGDCYIVQAFSERGDGQSSSTPLTVCDTQPPKPAEHVIEIKTRRAKVPLTKARASDRCNVMLQGPMVVKPLPPTVCERVTRELWIDGVRWGVVKGLE